MSKSNTSAKVISYNIQSLGTDKYMTVNNLLKRCDFLLLQETWKFEHDFINIIKREFDGYECIHTSGMDERVPLNGRPYGGVGILFKSNLNCTTEKIDNISKRLCALKVTDDNSSMLLFNIYMPNDMRRPGEELDEFFEILAEVKDIVSKYSPINVIIGGDFNCDLGRNNLQSRALESFVENENLHFCINSNVSNVPYTRTLNQSFSTIDHCIVSDNLISNIHRYETMFIPNNFSDHFPLYLEIELELSYVQLPKATMVSKTNWLKCTDDCKKMYKNEIENELLHIRFDHDAITCRNLKCKIHTDYIKYLYTCIIDICIKSSVRWLPAIGGGECKKGKVVPGWNENVRPFFEKSLFWHDIWVQNGKPRGGEVANIMRLTRARYHYAIRNSIKSNIKIRNDKMAEAVSLNNERNLWLEVKKMNKNNQVFSNLIDGQIGPENIGNLFHNKNKELFNSVGYDNETMSNLKNRIENMVNESIPDNVIFSVNDVKKAVLNLKNGKKEESGLDTDHFINGPDRLFVIISIVFNSMMIHGMAPSDFLVGTMIPIVKDHRKSCKRSDNYRTLTLGTILSKVFDILILNKHNSYFNTSELQYGFKENSSTVMSAFMVNQTIAHYRGNVNVLLLDASKAFDRIDFIKLFEKLIKRGLSPIIIRLILNMYTCQKFQIKWNGVMSDMFDVSNGVRQGGVMSPVLFGIYIDDLLLELKRNGTGCFVGHHFCGAFGYADDIILLCPTLSGLKEMIKICESYAIEHNILFNGTKSKLLIFGREYDNPNVIVNGYKVDVCIKAEYLGIILNTENKYNDIEDGVTTFNVSFNRFLANFNTCRISIKNKLFHQYCCAYYGSQLWPLWNSSFENICVKWRKAVRKIWDLPYRTHCAMLPIIADAFPIEISLECKFVKFLKSTIGSHNRSVAYMANFMKSNCNSIFGHNVRHLYLKYGLTSEELLNMSIGKIKDRFYCRWLDSVNDDSVYSAVMTRELSLMKDGIYRDFFNEEQNNFLINFLCTT